MVHTKKKALTFILMIALLVLTACGGNSTKTQQGDDQTVDTGDFHNPREHTADKFMQISYGLEEHSLWLKMDQYPDRKTILSEILVFEDGHVTYYSSLTEGHRMEDLLELADSEIIEIGKEQAAAIYEGPYKLDITLDNLGQYTDAISLIIEKGTSIDRRIDVDTIVAESTAGGEDKEAFLEQFKTEVAKDPNLEIVGEKLVETSEIEEEEVLKFGGSALSQTIFETTYAGVGLYESDYGLFTKVDKSFVGFRMDDPDTKNKRVTVEGK